MNNAFPVFSYDSVLDAAAAADDDDDVDDWCCSHEAMSDVIALMGSLVDNKGRILVPHLYDAVEQLTLQESSAYDSNDFDMASTVLSG